MDPNATIPEDLSTLDNDALQSLIDDAKAEAEGLLADAPTPESVGRLEALAGAVDALQTELDTRATAAAELVSRQTELAAKFGLGADEDTEDGEETIIPDDASELDGETGEPLPEKIAVTAGAGLAMPKPRPAVKEMAARRPAAAAPKPSPAAFSAFMTPTKNAVGVGSEARFESSHDIAAAIVDKLDSLGGDWGGERTKLSIAHAKKNIEAKTSGDPFQNFETLQSVRKAQPALVASGTACAPLTPVYEFFRLAEEQNPVESALGVVQAPRGGFRYLAGAFIDTNAGTTIDLSSQSRVYTGSTVQNTSGPKSCATATCPSPLDELVSALSQCVTFDNLEYRAFPELVDKFLADVAVLFAERKEVFYLDYINSKSSTVTADYGYGAARNLVNDWSDAAIGYRKRARMSRNAPIQVMAPDWALDAIKKDMVNDNSLGMNYLAVPDAMVEDALRTHGLAPVWYNDNPTGISPSQKFNGAQASSNAALNRPPKNVVAFIFAPGSFVRLDGGSLDVGLVRDSVLNGTNNLQLFMEEWLGAAFLANESIRLTSAACPNGVAPSSVTAHVCT